MHDNNDDDNDMDLGLELDDALDDVSDDEAADADLVDDEEETEGAGELFSESAHESPRGVKRGREEETPHASQTKVKQEAAVFYPHPGFFSGMCIVCGTFEEDVGTSCRPPTAGVGVVHSTPAKGMASRNPPDEYRSVPTSSRKMTLSRVVREEGVKKQAERTRNENKLTLVLDLDHTLLNSARVIDITPEDLQALQGLLNKEHEGCPHGPHSCAALLHHIPHIGMWTKLRPHTREFLKEANKYYKLYIYTMGELGYAQQMANLLDPDREFFADPEQGDAVHRIIAREDTNGRRKTLEAVSSEDSTLILDDSAAVWPHNKANLLEIDRYHFFRSSASSFKAGPSLLERSSDEDAEQGSLATLLNILKRMHGACFDEDGSQDCRDVLAKLYSELLSGVVILFSHVLDRKKRPEEQMVYKLAKKLGATIVSEECDEVTHLVAGASGTDKEKWAKRKKITIVRPDWLQATMLLWQRQDEAAFPVASKRCLPTDTDDLTTVLRVAGGGSNF